MPTVYGALGSPFVRKVLVALAEKDIKYDFEQLLPFNMSAENRTLSPLGKIPAFRDGDRTLADSSVIIAYLEKIKPKPALYPSEPYEYARALWFEEYGDGGLAPIVSGKIFFQRIVGPRFLNLKTDEAVVKKAIEEELPPMFDYLESQIGSSDWLVGNRFTIGDIGIATQFVNLQFAGAGVDAKRWPKLAAYLARAHGRASFKGVINQEKKAFGIP